ncbi:hypothetical protein [Streptomyces anulatus]|uniref:hypothetical protein n=1 Tax=Streptomyces anulatus TaxID=1892 RepID=UPI001C26E50D|nr:hypothetical protein [Streptomyces anulatus]
MYAIRELLPTDQPAAELLWARRVNWARTHGIGPIRIPPLAAASAAPLPLVLTCDSTVVALATLTFPADLNGADRTQGRGPTLYLERLVTDPDIHMPEAGPLSWIATTGISDVAARKGYDWMRMRVAPARLAAHLQTRLAWELDGTVRRDGATVHLLRRPAERSDAIRALVPTRALADVDRGMPASASPVEAVLPASRRVLPPVLARHSAGRTQ